MSGPWNPVRPKSSIISGTSLRIEVLLWLVEVLGNTLERAQEIFWNTLEVYRPDRKKPFVCLPALASILVCITYLAILKESAAVEIGEHVNALNYADGTLAGCQPSKPLLCPSNMCCKGEGELRQLSTLAIVVQSISMASCFWISLPFYFFKCYSSVRLREQYLEGQILL
jgi:hypothetical protein